MVISSPIQLTSYYCVDYQGKQSLHVADGCQWSYTEHMKLNLIKPCEECALVDTVQQLLLFCFAAGYCNNSYGDAENPAPRCWTNR